VTGEGITRPTLRSPASTRAVRRGARRAQQGNIFDDHEMLGHGEAIPACLGGSTCYFSDRKRRFWSISFSGGEQRRRFIVSRKPESPATLWSGLLSASARRCSRGLDDGGLTIFEIGRAVKSRGYTRRTRDVAGFHAGRLEPGRGVVRTPKSPGADEIQVCGRDDGNIFLPGPPTLHGCFAILCPGPR